jgi:hypothetical protein
MKQSAFLLIVLSFSIARAQLSPKETNILSPLAYNRNGNEFWAVGGAAIAEKGLSASPINNPAAISLSSPTITMEGIWKLKGDYLYDIGYNNLDLLPSYVSFGIPLNQISIELGYCNTYSEKLSIGNIEITTESQPDGTGEFITASSTSKVHTGFGSICVQALDNLSIGGTLGVDYIDREEAFWQSSAIATGSKLRIICGMQYQPCKVLGLGISVIVPTYAKLNYEIQGSNLQIQRNLDTTIAGNNPTINTNLVMPEFSAKSPLCVQVGTSFTVLPAFKLFASTEYQHWSSISEDWEDIWQFHFGITAELTPEFSVRAGYFTQEYPFVQKYPLVSGKFFNQQFLTAGVAFNISNRLSLMFTFLTSKSFTSNNYYYPDESFHESSLSGGFSFSL